MLVTDDTSHVDRFWLKDWVLVNIAYMLVTADTSHADRSWLKDCTWANIDCVSVTADTSHDPIGPCGPLEQSPTSDSLMHASTASWSSVLFWGANAAVTATTKACRVGALAVMVRTRVGTEVHMKVTYQGKKSMKLKEQRTQIKSFPQSAHSVQVHTFLSAWCDNYILKNYREHQTIGHPQVITNWDSENLST